MRRKGGERRRRRRRSRRRKRASRWPSLFSEQTGGDPRAARGFVSRDGHGHGDILEVLPQPVELTDCIGSRAAGLHESTAGQDIILATVWTITLTLADTVDEFILPLCDPLRLPREALDAVSSGLLVATSI
jgi:hypothetical protein